MLGTLLTGLLFLQTSFSHSVNSTSNIPPSWVEIGKPALNTLLEFGILLPQNNINILEDLLKNKSNPNHEAYGRWLNRDQINAIVSSDQKYFNLIYDWINNASLSSYKCLNTADNIYCKMTVKSVNSLFDTEILKYKNIRNNATFYSGRKKGYTIPTQVSESIELLVGIEKYLEKNNKNKLKARNISNQDFFISPLSLGLLYNISEVSLSQMDGVCSQSVVEFLNDVCFNKKNLEDFLQDNNLPALKMTKQDIIGKCDWDTDDPDVEASLDIQYQMGASADAGSQIRQQYVSVSDWLYQFANILYNHPEPPLVNSMSYGWAEWDQCDPEVFPVCYISGNPEVYSKRTNIEFMKLALRGITLLASSGDAGAAGRTNEECMGDTPLNPVFPTSSPYVLSVGGTIVMNPHEALGTLSPLCTVNKCIGSGNELNCNFDRCGWTSGGGFSNFFERPWWQVNASENYLASKAPFPPAHFFNRGGRVYPDIALVSHNYLVKIGDAYMGVDGTSASSPAVSGMISLLNNLRASQNKSALGLVAPLLYDMSQKCPKCFKDIIEGNNNSTEATDCPYGYTAAPGYDAVYGLGLPNFYEIYKYVENMIN